ncbi:hypothetical protein Arub01_33050 [Actinomadura rubrobrunea]|uniref:Uncharacterized protein n=1 Tax=Actinomadura rubrobrunea TaxID=115335 RepID=A0A9W6PY21_9ACTN|nr:hypothetical protein Arub01_33050 [Actinomadura rubrobrunea]
MTRTNPAARVRAAHPAASDDRPRRTRPERRESGPADAPIGGPDAALVAPCTLSAVDR